MENDESPWGDTMSQDAPGQKSNGTWRLERINHLGGCKMHIFVGAEEMTWPCKPACDWSLKNLVLLNFFLVIEKEKSC